MLRGEIGRPDCKGVPWDMDSDNVGQESHMNVADDLSEIVDGVQIFFRPFLPTARRRGVLNDIPLRLPQRWPRDAQAVMHIPQQLQLGFPNAKLESKLSALQSFRRAPLSFLTQSYVNTS